MDLALTYTPAIWTDYSLESIRNGRRFRRIEVSFKQVHRKILILKRSILFAQRLRSSLFAFGGACKTLLRIKMPLVPSPLRPYPRLGVPMPHVRRSCLAEW